ncbi:hypothetical protein FGO68_gene129 [Halteria grandinella]|uniref:Uncharacterized protein n=1 Tax=Halteria grandinella TaxID=5974 RepID=A0A8J8SVP9_HALGN|nr:hypothetical protein FGO68_gene129 [Halteria grandinella]
MNGGELQILFIKHDDKQEFINRVFKREKKKFTQLSEVKLSLSLSEGTLVYAWGNATKGKLGLSNDLSLLKGHPQFFSECKSIQAQYDPDQQETEEDQQQEIIFTPIPQPIISLMGVKIRQFSLGRDHCLALTQDGDVYGWGDNSKHQLGLKLNTESPSTSTATKQNTIQKQPTRKDDAKSESSVSGEEEKEASISGSTIERQAAAVADNESNEQLFRQVVGVPTLIDGIKAKVNFVSCGYYQSFASIKLV